MLGAETGGLAVPGLLDLIIWWAMQTRVASTAGSVMTEGGSWLFLSKTRDLESQDPAQIPNLPTSSCLTLG